MWCVCPKIIVIIHFMFNSLSHICSCRLLANTLRFLSHIQPYISHTCKTCASGFLRLGRDKALNPETKHCILTQCHLLKLFAYECRLLLLSVGFCEIIFFSSYAKYKQKILCRRPLGVHFGGLLVLPKT